MNRDAYANAARFALSLARSGVVDIVRNRLIALSSIVLAVILWAFIVDVENPRVEGLVPGDDYQPIPVEAVNLPDGLLLTESLSVRVRVRADADRIDLLTSDDFRATIDLSGARAGETVSRVVRVEPSISGVVVVGVEPSDVLVTLQQVAVREVPVSVRVRGDLPAGYRLAEGAVATADPPIVTITGRADLVESVATVEIEVNVTGVRETEFVTERELVARTAGGNLVAVRVSPSRARATVPIEQVLSQRVVTVLPVVTGTPAPGYRVTSITVEPGTVTATGPTDVIEGLRPLSTARIDVSGAQDEVQQTVALVAIQNVTTDRQSVTVKVVIEPYLCGSAATAPCGSMSVYVAPVFENVPQGLRPVGAYTVRVGLSGPLPDLALIDPDDLRVTVSLAGTSAGENVLVPSAVLTLDGMPGVVVTSVDPVNVRLEVAQ